MMSTKISLHEETTTSLGAPASRVTQELPPFAELADSIGAEQSALQRDVLLWQRWVRYLAIATMMLLSTAFGTLRAEALVPLAIIGVCYTAVVMSTAWRLRQSPPPVVGRWAPALMFASDIAAVAGVSFLTSAPQQLYRILLLGFLSMQLAVFHFGRRLGVLAGVLAVGAYVALELVVPPFIPGPAESAHAIAFNVALFSIIAIVLVHTFGSFRERMVALHAYCRIAERGEGGLPPLPRDRWPDELTLLATSFQEMHARLAEQIGSDPLTGCMNRRSLMMRLRADLRAARRRASTVGVVVVDVDRFKEINDTYGHGAGDQVLQQLSEIMRATARDTDAVARFGGDEFVIALPDTSWDGAIGFAERLRSRVNDYTFGSSDLPLSTSLSIGVALGYAVDPISPESLLKDADAALYRAKTAGRNRVFS